MNGEMHDTCEVMSGRVQYLESEMKTQGSEMKEMKRLLHEVLRRLPEDHPVVTIGDDEMKVTFARKIARPTFPTVACKTARPRTAVAATDLPFAAQPAVASSSVTAPAAQYNESAAPSHDNPDVGDLPDVSASNLSLHRLSTVSFSRPPNSFSTALESFKDIPYVPIENLIPEDTPSPSAQPPSLLPNIRGSDTTSAHPCLQPRFQLPLPYHLTLLNNQAGPARLVQNFRVPIHLLQV